MKTLAEHLDAMTVQGELFESLSDHSVRCFACGHRCLIRDGRRGICKVRFNRDGVLMVPWGYVAGLQVDPIEKKPFYHLLAGSDALTFGMLGCDFHCSYCQNWVSSQALRDPAAESSGRYVRKISAQEIVAYGRRSGAAVVASSYNEPLITSEWATAIFKLAQDDGMQCVYISNGNATPEVLAYLRPFLVGYKIDLKTMQDRQYRQLGGVLNHVLDSIQQAHALGLWVEVVTLVVPGFNDSVDELMDTARFIASVSLDIPWHISAFHPDYKMVNAARTSIRTLRRAAEIGQEAGLRYVYAGNMPGQLPEYEHTYCHQCGTCLIERFGYVIQKYDITLEGNCPRCGVKIPGVWTQQPEKVRLGGPGTPRWVP
ncbi:MAG: AmmeMemoRadiSam system radical SAM enzyme [Chloroflexi bacterium]|nr:AmmeMemoRadiSam system radical SAM enzyme [Chloroflexota bacterium]